MKVFDRLRKEMYSDQLWKPVLLRLEVARRQRSETGFDLTFSRKFSSRFERCGCSVACPLVRLDFLQRSVFGCITEKLPE